MNNNFFENLNFDAGTSRLPISSPIGDRIIYLSSDGSEDNDGISAETPRCDIKRVPEYLKAGFSVLLKAGSVWYVPGLAWKLFDINATEKQPLIVGTYGEGDAPVVADMHAIYKDSWILEGENIYSTPIIGDVIRFYVNDIIYPEVNTESELDGKTFLQRDGKVYLKADALPNTAEYLSIEDGVEPEHTIEFKNVSYITFQNFIIKGCAQWAIGIGKAPSDHFIFDHMEFRSMYKYCFSVGASVEAPDAYHNALTFTNCIMDRTWSNEAFNCFREDIYAKTRTTDAIFLTGAHIGAYIAGNIIRDYGHSAINLHASDKYSGIHNCIIEHNVVSGTNSGYLRACETIGPDGMCTNNTVRYNYFYDLTNSCHLMGDNNKYYCNVFAYIKPTVVVNVVQPFAMDAMTWKWDGYEFVARGNIYANNTIYNCAAALAFGGNDYVNTVANNLFIGWNYPGAVKMEKTKEEIAFKNNCFYSEENDNVFYGQGAGADFKLCMLNERELSSGNIFADPKLKAPENNDFTLSNDSPCSDAGIALRCFIDEPYLDINGVPFDSEHPSIGAFSILKDN